MIFQIFLHLSLCLTAPVNHLLSHHVHANSQRQENLVTEPKTTLEWFCFHGDHGMVEELIAAGADPSENSNACLRIACYNGHDDIVSLLLSLPLSYGVDPSVDDSICLKYASDRGHLSIRDQLLALDYSRGVDPTAENYRVILQAVEQRDYHFLIWVMMDFRLTSKFREIKEAAIQKFSQTDLDNDQKTIESSSLGCLIKMIDLCGDLFSSMDAKSIQVMGIILAALGKDSDYVNSQLYSIKFTVQQYNTLIEAATNLGNIWDDESLKYLGHHLIENIFYYRTDPTKNGYEALVELAKKRNWGVVDFFLKGFTRKQLEDALITVQDEQLISRIESYYTTGPTKNGYEALVELAMKRNWEGVDFFLKGFTREQLEDALITVQDEQLISRIKSYYTTDPTMNGYEALVELAKKGMWDGVDLFLKGFTHEQIEDALIMVKYSPLRTRIRSYLKWE